MRTIIFLNGLGCPMFVGKSPFVWKDDLWQEYNRIYQHSRIPTSDTFVEKELDRLSALCARYENPIVAGHSLGAWWAANLACRPHNNISQMVMFTPLGTTNTYPIFNSSEIYNPELWRPRSHNIGLDKTLVMYGHRDLIVPAKEHSVPLIDKFQATTFELRGGHLLQDNHRDALYFMKDWLESSC